MRRQAYPLQDKGGCGRSQLPLERHNKHRHQEAEQGADEVESQGQPLVPCVQSIKAPAWNQRLFVSGSLGSREWIGHYPLSFSPGPQLMQGPTLHNDI